MAKHLKNNFKEILTDLKTLVSSGASLVVDVVTVPVSACKDVRDAFKAAKEKKQVNNETAENTVVKEGAVQNA